MSKKLVNTLIILVVILLIAAMSSCSKGTNENETKLSDAEYESLMKQVAQKDVDICYDEYLRDEAFAVAEVFGVDREGDQGTAYAYLNEGDYVVLKGKAYILSGSAGEVILKYNYTDGDVILSEVEWGDLGELKEGWIKENFPAIYLERANAYSPYDVNGKSILEVKLIEKVENALGVPVETESFLEIDTDKGTYEIWRVKDDHGATFDTETMETGKLEDLR